MRAAGSLTVPDVLPRVQALFREHPAACCLHIVLSDANYDDDSVRFCVGFAREQGHQRCEDLARTLLSMSVTQRRKLARLGRHPAGETATIADREWSPVDRPRDANGHAIVVATVPSQRFSKRAARSAERRRLAEIAKSGKRCGCAHARLRLARAPHAALVCDACGAWYEDGEVSFPKGKKR